MFNCKKAGVLIGSLIVSFAVIAGFKFTDNMNITKLMNTPDITLQEFNNNITAAVQKMPLEQKIGQMLMPDYRKWKGNSVTVINKDISAQIKKYNLGGIILFRNNFISETQTKTLLKNYQTSSNIPLMFGVDQEGGIVNRLPYFPNMPGNMALGAAGSKELTEKVGLAIGSELMRLGIHMDFGPVLDINSNPYNPVIGVRAFGDNSDLVTELGLAYIKGLNSAGIASVGKHFPGHGDLDTDSHYTLPTSTKTIEQLSDLELKPFQAAIDSGIQGIMIAHIVFSKIDGRLVTSIKDGLPIGIPASLSREITSDLLRKRMGFDGLVFTDAMEMNAVSSHFKIDDAAVLAVNAGADVILMPEDIKIVYNGLLKAVKAGIISEEKINEAVIRIMKFKAKYVLKLGMGKISTMSLNDATKLEQEVAKASITIVNNDGIIPVDTNKSDKIIIIGFNDSDIENMSKAIPGNSIDIIKVKLNKFRNIDGVLAKYQRDKLTKACSVIVVTNITDLKNDMWQVKAAQNIIAAGMKTVIVAVKNPYKGIELKGKYAYLAQYSNCLPSFKAACDVIFGKSGAPGKLPVNLSITK